MARLQKIRILGWFFLILGIISVFWHVVVQDWRYAVWFCNHAMIIVGIAVLNRNRFWLTAMLNWALIPVGIWMVDFFGKLLFDTYVFHITDYLFQNPLFHLLSFQHLFTVPLMLYAFYLLGKPAKNAWVGTALHGAVLWIISYFFITPDYNINCVHEPCLKWLAMPNYILIWPLIALAMFLVTNWFLVWLSARKAD